jgi:ELWxxDGT repeat protein
VSNDDNGAGTDAAAVQNTYFFSGRTSNDANELWKSDGTAAGTVRIKDIMPGKNGSSPQMLTPAGNLLYFVADDGTSGRELWKSDGTEAGTVRVSDLQPGPASSNPVELTAVGSTLYFFANDGVNGQGLYRYDGSAAAPVRISGAPGYQSSWSQITAVGSVIYFNLGSQLWKSDGTSGGTALVATIPNGTPYQTFLQFEAVGTTLYFLARADGYGYELWRSDGTAASTKLVKDLYPGSYPDVYDYVPRSLTRVGQEVYLIGGVSDLWRSDGTAAGTTLVKSFDVLSSQSYPTDLTAVGNQLLLVADDATYGYELWRSNGTSAGTQVVKDIRPGTVSSGASALAVAGNTLYVAADEFVREVHSTLDNPTLWVSDGTEAGTKFLFDPDGGITGWPSGPRAWATVGDTLYFGSKYYLLDRLYRTNGTGAGTQLVAEGVTSNGATALGARVLFSNQELWVSDGTAAGTALLKDIWPGSASSSPQELTRLGNTILFTADDGTAGRELWRSDGTAAGTVLVKDIRPGVAASSPHSLTVAGGYVYFVANDGTSGDELWKSDGTAAGTVRVKDINASASAAGPQNLTAVGSTLFFTVDSGYIGNELWKSDGTDAGTVLVKDINPGSYGSYPAELTAVGATLFFRATSAAGGNPELWKSDGTAAGTVRVKPAIWGNYVGKIPYSFKAVGNTLYFVADDGTTGAELWQSDGTDAGTVLVEDIYPGSNGSSPTNLIAFQNTLFFTADDGLHGRELWTIDTLGVRTRVADVGDVAPDPRSTPVNSIDVVFSKPISLSTFRPEDVVLERDGAPVPLTSTVSIQLLTGSTYRINGLSAFTTEPGHYVFGVRGSGLRDTSGQIVAGTATDAWVTVSAPQVQSVAVNSGAAQRSMVTHLTVTFSRFVTFAGSPAAAFRLTRLGPGTPGGDVALAVDLSGSTAAQTVARLTFSGALTQFGSLMDGNYQLTVLAAQVSAAGQQLDGDGDGAPGGDYTTTPADSVFRYFGDVNGDRVINGLDFGFFRSAFGTAVGDPGYLVGRHD